MIPETPQAFLEQFFPAQFELHRHAFAVGENSSAATIVVEGEGAWSLRVAGGRLQVTPGKDPDTRLQVIFSRPDFEAVVCRRAREDLAAAGRVSEASLAPFKVLFSLESKASFFEREPGSMLFIAADGEAQRRLHLVPGAGEPPDRARTVFRLSLADMLRLLGRQANGVVLFLTGKLKISGDLGYALRANALLK